MVLNWDGKGMKKALKTATLYGSGKDVITHYYFFYNWTGLWIDNLRISNF